MLAIEVAIVATHFYIRSTDLVSMSQYCNMSQCVHTPMHTHLHTQCYCISNGIVCVCLSQVCVCVDSHCNNTYIVIT